MTLGFVLVAWVGCLFLMFRDIFRSDDLSGVAKAAWTVLVFAVPFLGVLLYLVVRGGGMHHREVQHAGRGDRTADGLTRKLRAARRSADPPRR